MNTACQHFIQTNSAARPIDAVARRSEAKALRLMSAQKYSTASTKGRLPTA